MNIILLSGGSGKRLWPLSNDVRSKQFLRLFKRRDGAYESMLQRVYRNLNNIGIQTNVTIATSKKQVSAVYAQLGNDIDVCTEPCRRDTFPAIALSAAYLVDVKKVKPSEAVVVCPVDPLVTNEYFRALIALQYQAEMEMSNIVLMGIVPTFPADKFGYIVPDEERKLSGVKSFEEKPSLEKAQEYVNQGALWNSGVFAFKLQYVLNKAQELLGYSKYDDLLAHYDSFKEESFDVAVVEKEKSVQVMRFSGNWMDMGTWDTLTEAMTDPIMGKGVIDETSTGVRIINETELPILAVGLHDVVISASEDGFLVADKDMSSFIKPFVDKIDQTGIDKGKFPSASEASAAGEAPAVRQASALKEEAVTSESKKWGSQKVMDEDSGSKVLKLTLNQGATMEYLSHGNRDEIWVVISGEGQVILDDRRKDIKKGDIITMKAGCKHTIVAGKDLKLIEIRLGDDVSENDAQEFSLPDA